MRAFVRLLWVASFAAGVLFALAAGAQSVFQLAENNVPVALVQVTRSPQYTEIQLKPQQSLKGVCWHANGPNSPYLLSSGRRYHFVSGDSITICPARRDYDAQQAMVLRFEQLDSQVREFSLVEGEGGENQMLDRKSSNETYWNFIRVRLN